MGSKDHSLSIEFAPGTSLYRERDLVSQPAHSEEWAGWHIRNVSDWAARVAAD